MFAKSDFNDVISRVIGKFVMVKMVDGAFVGTSNGQKPLSRILAYYSQATSTFTGTETVYCNFLEKMSVLAFQQAKWGVFF